MLIIIIIYLAKEAVEYVLCGSYILHIGSHSFNYSSLTFFCHGRRRRRQRVVVEDRTASLICRCHLLNVSQTASADVVCGSEVKCIVQILCKINSRK